MPDIKQYLPKLHLFQCYLYPTIHYLSSLVNTSAINLTRVRGGLVQRGDVTWNAGPIPNGSVLDTQRAT